MTPSSLLHGINTKGWVCGQVIGEGTVLGLHFMFQEIGFLRGQRRQKVGFHSLIYRSIYLSNINGVNFMGQIPRLK